MKVSFGVASRQVLGTKGQDHERACFLLVYLDEKKKKHPRRFWI